MITPDARAALALWVDHALGHDERPELARKARFLRDQCALLSTKPLIGSLKGVTDTDLNGWADRLEQEAKR